MKRTFPKIQIVLDNPDDTYIDSDLESIILDEEEVLYYPAPNEPGSVFDPIWDEG